MLIFRRTICDFSLIGEEYVLQVGMKDFRVDLLMHHRGLNCLVAIELKVTDFKPEHLGKLQFYLEVLDKQIRKPHENPSIGRSEEHTSELQSLMRISYAALCLKTKKI